MAVNRLLRNLLNCCTRPKCKVCPPCCAIPGVSVSQQKGFSSDFNTLDGFTYSVAPAGTGSTVTATGGKAVFNIPTNPTSIIFSAQNPAVAALNKSWCLCLDFEIETQSNILITFLDLVNLRISLAGVTFTDSTGTPHLIFTGSTLGKHSLSACYDDVAGTYTFDFDGLVTVVNDNVTANPLFNRRSGLVLFVQALAGSVFNIDKYCLTRKTDYCAGAVLPVVISQSPPPGGPQPAPPDVQIVFDKHVQVNSFTVERITGAPLGPIAGVPGFGFLFPSTPPLPIPYLAADLNTGAGIVNDGATYRVTVKWQDVCFAEQTTTWDFTTNP